MPDPVHGHTGNHVSVQALPSVSTTRPPQSTQPHQAAPRSRFGSKWECLRNFCEKKKGVIYAAITIFTLVIAIIALLPAFRYGKDTTDLALWTARKDFLEFCQNVSRLDGCNITGKKTSLSEFLEF